MSISLIASSVRHHLWLEFMDSLKNETIDYEVIFAGNLDTFQVRPYLERYKNLKYIHTGNIPPAQCYAVALAYATKKLVMWVADDCEFSEGLLSNVCKLHNSFCKDNILISIKTNENSTNNDLNDHRFFGSNINTPLMAPLGVISRDYLMQLGGLDRRFICGQYENDIAMRVYADGGCVVKYEEGVVNIEHLKKHGKGTKFWTGYNHDRKVLEDTWVIGGYREPSRPLPVFSPKETGGFYYYYPLENREVSKTPLIPFEPYSYNENFLTVSQCPVEWK